MQVETKFLCYAGKNRMYQYGQARWISPDPAGLSAVDLTNPSTFNRYAYVGGDPANNVDPSGLDGNGSGNDCFSTTSTGGDGTIYVTVTCRSNYVTLPSFTFTIQAGGGQIGGSGASGGSGQSGGSGWAGTPQRWACAAKFGNDHSIGALFGGGKVAMFFGGNTISSLANLGLAVTGNGPAPQNPGMVALSGPALGLPVNDVLRFAGKQSIPQLTSASGFVRGQAVQAVFNAATGSSSLTTLGGEVALQGGITAGEFASGVALAKFAYDVGSFAYGYFAACGK